MFKVLGMILSIAFLSTSIQANDFGTYTQRAKDHIRQEQVKDIISGSTALRETNTESASREVASFEAAPQGSQDRAWAQEYDALMTDTSSVDYLKKAAEL